MTERKRKPPTADRRRQPESKPLRSAVRHPPSDDGADSSSRPHARFTVVSLHPAIDRTIEAPTLDATLVRGKLVLVEAAGKGVNIVHTLSNFGHCVTAMGFLGAWDRDIFLSSFRKGYVQPRFVEVRGATRQNVTVIARDTGRDTHITAGALTVDRPAVAQLQESIERHVWFGDWVVFTGSRPEGMGLRDYRKALRVCAGRGARLCVDASGGMLRTALLCRPWLIKPNRDELAELIGAPLPTLPHVVAAARQVRKLCQVVLVSLGAEGALLATAEGAWHARDPRKVRAVHTVGCGDALLAGFLSAASGFTPLPDCLRFGVACGSACVRSPYASLHSRQEADRLLLGVRVEKVAR